MVKCICVVRGAFVRKGHCPDCAGQQDSRNSPDKPQRERDPADVSGTQQVTDAVGLAFLWFGLLLWDSRTRGKTNALRSEPSSWTCHQGEV